MTMICKGVTGKKYILGQKPFADGGEGVIYDVTNADKKVAKIYHADRLSHELEKKLIVMVNNPPGSKVLNQVAWPLDILYDSNNRFCGFVMPKLDITDNLSDVYKYTPQDHNQISIENKIRIATNICVVINAVHEAGYVFGDFNPENIGVNAKTGGVAFLDTDTYHIFDPISRKTYRCKVCKPGYVAPELIRVCDKNQTNFETTRLPTFTTETDKFSLAIHIFRLLMNGAHPYTGINDTDNPSTAAPPGLGNDAIKLDNYSFKPGKKPQAPYVPSLESLPQEVSGLFHRAFIEGRKDPKRRPSATEWYQALIGFENNLKTCIKNKTHQYKIGLTKCPYCEADRRFNIALLKGSSPQQRLYAPPEPISPGSTQSQTPKKQTTPSQYPSPKQSTSPIPTSPLEGQKKASAALFLAIGSLFIPYLGFLLSTAAIVVSKKAKRQLKTYDAGYGKAKAAGVIGWLVTSTYLVALCMIIGLGGPLTNSFGRNQSTGHNLLDTIANSLEAGANSPGLSSESANDA
jgi:serine/threonine protein kinase